MLIPVACFIPWPAADRIAGDDVPKLVRDHALQLVHIVGRLEEAGLDVNGLAGRDECVDLGIVEQDDVDAVGIKPGSDDQRARHVLEQPLGLGVAEHRGPESSCCANAGRAAAMLRTTASITRRTKRASGEFIAVRLASLALNRR